MYLSHPALRIHLQHSCNLYLHQVICRTDTDFFYGRFFRWDYFGLALKTFCVRYPIHPIISIGDTSVLFQTGWNFLYLSSTPVASSTPVTGNKHWTNKRPKYLCPVQLVTNTLLFFGFWLREWRHQIAVYLSLLLKDRPFLSWDQSSCGKDMYKRLGRCYLNCFYLSRLSLVEYIIITLLFPCAIMLLLLQKEINRSNHGETTGLSTNSFWRS